jgi:hypothetical protein
LEQSSTYTLFPRCQLYVPFGANSLNTLLKITLLLVKKYPPGAGNLTGIISLSKGNRGNKKL